MATGAAVGDLLQEEIAIVGRAEDRVDQGCRPAGAAIGSGAATIAADAAIGASHGPGGGAAKGADRACLGVGGPARAAHART